MALFDFDRFDFGIFDLGTDGGLVYAPQLTSPLGGDVFNFGTVAIEWNINSPASSPVEENDIISYEIEYTENYNGAETIWHSITKRIESDQTSFVWNVGRMIKTDQARIRIRAHSKLLNSFSEYSESISNFSINIFKIMPPAILSPLSGGSYSDYITIILDESQTSNTYNQKVYYQIDYSSEDAGIGWTSLFTNIPVGSNVLRWNIDSLPSAQDYKLKLLATDNNQLQTTVTIVDDIKVSNPGYFIIDTTPPEAVIEISDFTSFATNKIDHIINVYADDETTGINFLQMKESSVNSLLTIGEVKDTNETNAAASDPCDFGSIKTVPFTPKVPWVFKDESGQKKLEVLLTDFAGNKSCTKNNQVFIPIYKTNTGILDFVTGMETVEKLTSTSSTSSTSTSADFEVLYTGTTNGELIRLSPSPKIVAEFNQEITALKFINGVLYVGTYNSDVDNSNLYKYVYTETPVLLNTFSSEYSKINSIEIFDDILYIGTEGGNLISYNNSSFTSIRAFDNQIKTLSSDTRYLYIGFYNSDDIYLFNGTTFFDTRLN